MQMTQEQMKQNGKAPKFDDHMAFQNPIAETEKPNAYKSGWVFSMA